MFKTSCDDLSPFEKLNPVGTLTSLIPPASLILNLLPVTVWLKYLLC